MSQITEGIQKLALAGIGATATALEKTDELVKEMVKKGESTVAHGKEVNEELKHNLKKAVALSEDKLKEMTDEELNSLKEQIESIQKDRAEKE